MTHFTYTFTSDEPLDVIEHNECKSNAHSNLSTRRFRRLFNELHARDEEIAKLRTYIDTADAWMAGANQLTPRR